MAVTAEEEALLELIRGRRAAAASSGFAQGYRTALLSSPRSPLFRRARSASEGSPGGGERAVVAIEPPLSPPPSAKLPDPPAEEGEAEGGVGARTSRHAKFDSTSSVASSRGSAVPIALANPSPSRPTPAAADRRPGPAASNDGDDDGATEGSAPGSPTAPDGFGLSPSSGSQASALPSPRTPSGGSVAVVDVLDAAQAGKSLTEALADAAAAARGRGREEVDGEDEEGDAPMQRGAYSRKKPPMLSVKLGSYRRADNTAAKRERRRDGEEDSSGNVTDDVMAAWNSLGGYSLRD